MRIDKDKCTGCGRCAEHCTADAIKWNTDTGKPEITDECLHCYCPPMDVCPAMAILAD